MKIKTAVAKVWAPIYLVALERPTTHAQYTEAAMLLKRYQRKFGNRHFKQLLRTVIKNGLWLTEDEA